MNRIKPFVVILVLILGFGVNLPILIAQDNPNTITFDNQSGQPALVNLIGPSSLTVEVPDGQSRTVHVAAGEYYITVRYGIYSYAKGDPFTVTQTTSKYSVITITLHKVKEGNYDIYPISKEEFENSIPLPQMTKGKEEAITLKPQTVLEAKPVEIQHIEPVKLLDLVDTKTLELKTIELALELGKILESKPLLNLSDLVATHTIEIPAAIHEPKPLVISDRDLHTTEETAVRGKGKDVKTVTGKDVGKVQGKLVFLGKPVSNMVLILGFPRPAGVLYSPHERPQGSELTTDNNGEFTTSASGKGEYTLYEIRSETMLSPSYEPLLWYDKKTKEIKNGNFSLESGQTINLGEMNYIKKDNTKISPADNCVTSATPQIIWGPYPNATSYRILLFNEPTGMSLNAGLDDTFKDAFLPITMATINISFQILTPLPKNKTGTDIHTLYVFYFNKGIPIAIGRVEFHVKR